MERLVGTVVYGLRAPIIGDGNDIAQISADTILNCQAHDQFKIDDKDVFALTESVVARAQGNYASVYEIQEDIEEKFNGKIDHLGVIFPILSRNRFSLILKGLALASHKVTVLFSFPGDEVGNHLVSPEVFEETGINPYSDVLTEHEWVEHFGNTRHEFTGINYIDFYREIVEEAGAEFQAIFSNDVLDILTYTHNIILGDVHSRARNRRRLEQADVAGLHVYSLDEILAQPRPGKRGYNSEYGLLGSNKATEEDLKLFPRDCQPVVHAIQDKIREATGKMIEVMVYGDGAFKDPTGRIWELADPVVSPAYTEGLEGIPNEVKLKYLADNDYAGLTHEEQLAAIRQDIQMKEADLVGSHLAEGTTPRQIPDLIGSLADLVSGSGDKGTPFVYIKGYFDNFGD